MDLVSQIPRLRRYARALTGDRHRADDLVQDTLERAWKKGSLWRPGTKLDAWLMTLMHNVFVNQWHAMRREPTQDLDDLPAEPAARPEQDDAFELRDVHAALARLPVEQRAVLLLVALDERSYEETAAILELPIGTVMSRLARARARLRHLLNDELPAEPALRRVK